MASGLTFPTLNPCISPYGLVEILNDFFLQIQTASTFNFDTFATSGSFNGEELTINNNQGGSFNVTWLNDLFVTGGSYDHGTSLITLGNSTGGTLSFSLSAITDELDSIVINSGNDFVTGSTFDQGTGIVTFTRQSGGTFTTDLSSIVNDLYTLSAVSSFDVTTGGSFNDATNDFTFNTYTGGSYSVNAGSLSANTYVTGATVDDSYPFNLSLLLNDGSSPIVSLSAFTDDDYVVSGSYSSGTSILTLNTLSGNTVNIDMSELSEQSNANDYVVSGVYDSGTSVMTLSTLSGNTIEVTGFTSENTYIFSGDVVGDSIMNFYGVGGYSFVVDVTSLSNAAQNISDAVYSADSSSIVFYASSGGTAFTVDGISKFTGGTYDSGVEELYLYDSTGGTLSITGFTDNYVTGGSYIASSTTIDLYDRSGNTVSIDASAFVSQTGVLAVSGGTNISTGGTQQYPIINLNDTINLGTINATNGNFNNVSSNSVTTVSLNATSISTTTLNSTTGYFNTLSAETYYSGSTPLDIIASNIAVNSLAFVSTDNYVANVPNTIVHSFSSTNVSVEVIDTNTNTRIDALVDNYQSASVDITLGQTLNDVKAVIFAGGATSAYTLDTSALSATTVAGSGNINVAGTSLNPIVSVIDSPSFAGLSVSGLATFNSSSATTLSGGSGVFDSATATTFSSDTYYSGSTPLFDIILAYGGGGGSSTSTTISEGANISTGGTSTNPSISVVDSPSFNNLLLSGQGTFNAASATTLSASTIWVTNMSGMSPVNINGIAIADSSLTGTSLHAIDSAAPHIRAGINETEYVELGHNDALTRSEIHFDPDDSGHDLYIVNGAGKETSAIFSNDGAVNLYYDNVQRLATSTGGGTLTGAWNTTTSFQVGTTLTVLDSTSLEDFGFQSMYFETANLDAENDPNVGGELIITDSTTSSLTAGKVYYLGTGAAWVEADASASATSINFLAIASGTDSSKGMLTKGLIPLDASNFGGTSDEGLPVYLSETSGYYTFDPPTTSGAVVRVIGHFIEQITLGRTNFNVLHFNPSNDWVQIS